MAIYHLTAKTGSRAGGQSALAKVQYLQREGRYARGLDPLVYTRSANLPAFAAENPAAYWHAADLYERSNGRLFKEVEVALPVELEPDEQRELVDQLVPRLLAGERLPYTLAIHAGQGHNPHCHILLSERVQDGIERPAERWFRRFQRDDPARGGARKTEALKPKRWLHEIRQAWADLVNRALERAGFLERVDHRTLAAQGIERIPQIHLGPDARRMEARGLETGRGDLARGIDQRNEQIAERVHVRERIDQLARRPREHPDRAIATPPGRPSEAGTRPETDRRTPADEASRITEIDLPAPSPEPSSDRPDEAPLTRSASRRGHSSPEPEPPLAAAPAESAEFPREPSLGGPHESAKGARARAPAGALEPPATESLGRRDRTAEAVSRQLRAMACGRFDVGIREASTGRLMQLEASPEEILSRLPQLKRLNARGNDIYVRPARDSAAHGLVLLDDLTSEALHALPRAGRDPAVVVETSPGSFQAWIRVGPSAEETERAEIARALVRQYDADPATGHPNPYGRLAGFTNQKAKHRTSDGLQPFALLRGASGRVAPDGRSLLREAARAIRSATRSAAPLVATPDCRVRTDQEAAIALYREEMQTLLHRTRDASRADFGAAARLAARGFNAEVIRAAMRAASPDLERRKPGHVEDYVHRTVAAALRAGERERERTVRPEEQELEP